MDCREFFQQLDHHRLNELVASERSEDLHLDFKLAEKSDVGGADRRNLAKAVSGFANAEGGVVIWGVDCRKNADGVDCATAVKEIDNVFLFQARLIEATATATSPYVIGTEHRVIETTANRGYVATYVPEVDTGPHMAKLGVDQYMVRIGSSFLKMEHFQIADMFGRRHRPKLQLVNNVKWHVGARQGDKALDESLNVSIEIYNHGRAIARDVLVSMSIPPFFQVQASPNFKHIRRQIRSSTEAYLLNDAIIHPGSSVYFGIVCLPHSNADKHRVGSNLEMAYELFADGTPSQLGRFDFTVPTGELHQR